VAEWLDETGEVNVPAPVLEVEIVLAVAPRLGGQRNRGGEERERRERDGDAVRGAHPAILARLPAEELGNTVRAGTPVTSRAKKQPSTFDLR
jgi:hypothetical protein